MKWWHRLSPAHRARQQWEAGLVWFRLRYLDASGTTRCINLLSRPPACGRVALYYWPGEVGQLHLGIPEVHVRLLKQMMADFGFSLKPMSPNTPPPPLRRLSLAVSLSWDVPFIAHVVNEQLFVGLVEGEKEKGHYFPSPAKGDKTAGWSLPEEPPVGLTLRPSWNGHVPSAHLVAHEPDPDCWLLGRTRSGMPLQASGQVNLYGRQEAIADWLLPQITQMMSVNPAGLVVIDGVGDLIPRLKRKAVITRLLGEQLDYVDIDEANFTNGFNPLAPAPGETTECTLHRWHTWFQGMQVHSHGLELLSLAWQDGVRDIPALRKWLKSPERQRQISAVSSLSVALNRLTANRALREWLEWPTNRFAGLPEKALFFACQGSSWDRQQLLQAVLLGAMNMPGIRLLVYGFPWKAFSMDGLQGFCQIIVTNGPLLKGSTVVLVESQSQGIAVLIGRFLGGDAQLGENLQLLGRGEGMVITGDEVVHTTWNTQNE